MKGKADATPLPNGATTFLQMFHLMEAPLEAKALIQGNSAVENTANLTSVDSECDPGTSLKSHIKNTKETAKSRRRQ